MSEVSVNLSKSRKRREKTEKQAFFVFAINNFHCCMEAISTTERKTVQPESEKPTCLEETIKKKQHRNNNILQVHTKIYRREKEHPTAREASLNESDTLIGRLGTSNTAQEQHGTSSSRPNEPKSH